jgi:N-methylhydantoinase A
VLGYLDPGYFLGGRLPLHRHLAEGALRERIAGPLGLELSAAAWAVHQVVNEQMAAAARMHAVEKGKDARRFPLFAFGGAGPVHACRVAGILGVREVLCPFGAGVGSTVGLLAAPLAFDFVRSDYALLEGADWGAVAALYAEMEGEGRRLLAQAGVAPQDVTLRRTADMRLSGQAHQISVPVPAGPLSANVAPAVLTSFEEVYRTLYRRTRPGVAVEVISWRVQVAGPPPALALRVEAPAGAQAGGAQEKGAEEAIKGQRPVYFPEAGGYTPTPVYDRYRLAPGATFQGPAVVEEEESTAVVVPRASCSIDAHWNLVIALPGG